MVNDCCPTCGAPVRIETSDEGTSHYVPLGDNHPERGSSARAELDYSLDVLLEHPYGHILAYTKQAQRIRDLFARLERERDEWQEVAEAAGRRLAAFNATARDRRGEHG